MLYCSITPSLADLEGGIDRTSDHSIRRSWYEAWRDVYKAKIEFTTTRNLVDSAFTAVQLLRFGACIRTPTRVRKLSISKDEGGLDSHLWMQSMEIGLPGPKAGIPHISYVRPMHTRGGNGMRDSQRRVCPRDYAWACLERG